VIAFRASTPVLESVEETTTGTNEEIASEQQPQEVKDEIDEQVTNQGTATKPIVQQAQQLPQQRILPERKRTLTGREKRTDFSFDSVM
jgi:hypothetical protein